MTTFRAALLASALVPVAAIAQQVLTVAPGPLDVALTQLGMQADMSIVASSALVGGIVTNGVQGAASVDQALSQLLQGTGLVWREIAPGTIAVTAPMGGSAEGGHLLDPIVVDGGMIGYHAANSTLGTRMDVPLRDVPQTVTVVGREELQDRQAVGLSAALEGIPNVTETSPAGGRGSTYDLRGFRGASYSIDGVPLNPAASRPEVMAGLANVERVEVLKGPASVLYGQGLPGGMINVVTRRPSDIAGGEVSVQADQHGYASVESSVTGPLNAAGTILGRLTAATARENSFVEERPVGESYSISGIVEWRPSDATTITFGADYARMDLPFDKGVQVMDDNRVLEPYDTWLSEKWSWIDADKLRLTSALEHRFSDAVQVRARLTYDRGDEHDTGIDNDGVEYIGGAPFIKRVYHDRTEDTESLSFQTEAEIRFTTGSIEHTALIGVQLSDGTQEFDSRRGTVAPISAYDPVHGAPMPVDTVPNNVSDKRVLSRSVFAQDLITFSPEWKALVGVRYDDYSARNRSYLNDRFSHNAEGALTGRVGLVWQPREDLSLYLSASQSFRPQSGVGRGNTTLDAEQGEQFEIGAKWDISPVLSANLSLFDITRSNVANSDTANPGMNWSVLTGEERSRGIEAEIVGELAQGWNLRASVGLLDGEVTRDVSNQGNDLRGIPATTASLWTTYDVTDALTIGGGAYHVGRRAGDAANSFFVDGYTRVDAMAAYTLSDRTALSVTVRNLLDKEYIASTSGRIESHPGASRTVMAKLDYRF